jgi:hypothetical protein
LLMFWNSLVKRLVAAAGGIVRVGKSSICGESCGKSVLGYSVNICDISVKKRI